MSGGRGLDARVEADEDEDEVRLEDVGQGFEMRIFAWWGVFARLLRRCLALLDAGGGYLLKRSCSVVECGSWCGFARSCLSLYYLAPAGCDTTVLGCIREFILLQCAVKARRGSLILELILFT